METWEGANKGKRAEQYLKEYELKLKDEVLQAISRVEVRNRKEAYHEERW